MCVQQFELLDEEVDSEHQVEQDSEDGKLAARDIHEVLEVAVVDVDSPASAALVVLVKSSSDCAFARSEHPADD